MYVKIVNRVIMETIYTITASGCFFEYVHILITLSIYMFSLSVPVSGH